MAVDDGGLGLGGLDGRFERETRASQDQKWIELERN